jgi:hypothetical protein
MAILVQQDPEDPVHSYIYWAVIVLLVLFVVVVLVARFA